MAAVIECETVEDAIQIIRFAREVRRGSEIQDPGDAAEGIAAATAVLMDAAAKLSKTAQKVADSRKNVVGQLPVLLTVSEAAELVGVNETAFRTRIQRGQVPGLVRTGDRIQVHREKLLAGLVKSKPGRAKTEADVTREAKRKESRS